MSNNGRKITREEVAELLVGIDPRTFRELSDSSYKLVVEIKKYRKEVMALVKEYIDDVWYALVSSPTPGEFELFYDEHLRYGLKSVFDRVDNITLLINSTLRGR